MGSWLYGDKGTTNDPQPPAAPFRVQSSTEGKAIPVGWGQARLAGNLIWYGDFFYQAVQQTGTGGGGKGGGDAGAQQANYVYKYTVSTAIALCEGPISDVLQTWVDKANAVSPAAYNFSIFDGSYGQEAWGYLSTNHPTEAFTYRGIAYVAATLQLGTSPNLGNFSFEVKFGIGDAIDGLPDADPKDVWVDALTNPHYGVGFPPYRLDTVLEQWSNCCLALGLVVSPVLVEQREFSAFAQELLRATNASARWSNGILTVVPWYDQDATGNGVTYTADVTPIYDIDDDDLLPPQGGGEDDSPISTTRRRRSDLLNAVSLEFMDRASNYDPKVAEAKDQAAIEAYGLRQDALRQMHMFADADAAQLSVALQLGREQIPVAYRFTLGPQFVLVDVEDILTLTRDAQGLDRQPVRVTEITENDDGSLSFEAEEFTGTAAPPLYGKQAALGATVNTNADPGNVNEPIIFEPTAEMLGGAALEIWGAISGEDLDVWGGCNVFVSYDGVTYQAVGPQVFGPARMGVLTAELPAVTPSPTGPPTIDDANTLAVDLSESGAELASGTEADMLALNTACYVNGEIVAYRDATLTGANAYDLDRLVRGAYSTTGLIDDHPAGARFARLDQGIFRIPFDQSRIGSTIYVKFQSFNAWGAGLQDLSELAPYTYVITGTALRSPLDPVANLRTVFEDGFMKIWWDEVEDFRTGVRYKVRVGTTWDGGLEVGDVAHPPFVAFGNGTFWVSAYVQPVPDLVVFSANPTSIAITGNTLPANIVFSSDQKADGWLGTMDNVAQEGVDPDAVIRLTGSGNILDAPDFLNIADVLNYGGITTDTGTYTIPSADQVDVGYVATAYVNVTWTGTGSPLGQDILSVADFLAMPDVLGAASAAFVEVYPEIRVSQDAVVWGDWQKFVPGVYQGRKFDFRMVLISVDPNTIAYCLSFAFAVMVPPRIDHYQSQAVPATAGGLTITFAPDAPAGSPANPAAPFNGGPNEEALPYVAITILNPQAGDTYNQIALSTSALQFNIMNAGSPVARTVSVIVEGY